MHNLSQLTEPQKVVDAWSFSTPPSYCRSISVGKHQDFDPEKTLAKFIDFDP